MDNTRQNTALKPETLSRASEAFAGYQLDQFPDRLRFLHRQLLSPKRDSGQQILFYLEAGCRMFGLEQGVYIRNTHSTWVPRCYRYDLNEAKSLVSIEAGPVQGLEQAVRSSSLTLFSPVDGRLAVNLDKLAYNTAQVKAYIATPVFIGDDFTGLLYFFSTNTVDKPYTAQDRETIVLMAEGVARMNEVMNVEPRQGVKEDEVNTLGFVTPGVKSFKEYSYQAQIPLAHGVAGKVVEVLQSRIGHEKLGIEFIATELSLSKRTLQRRLQQQNINFAQLRDQVRFHHSITYLVEQSHSIDRISGILDFSDRTSFTNAFKRWTGLSPSTFRKLFRDYV